MFPAELNASDPLEDEMIEPTPDPDLLTDGDELSTETPAETAPSETEGALEAISVLPPQADYDILPVVGLGGSAGSIAALQHFLDDMPADSGMAFVVVLHLAPNHESQLSQVLQSHTSMPVVSVTQQIKVEANHVYVIPPGKHLVMQGGNIVLRELENKFGTRVAVDLFFRTLASSHRSRAVAVVLSGLDSDGSIGIKRVKEHGGVTIAQDPDEAEHDGMPRSAIQTGMIDWVLPVGQMAVRLIEFWHNEQRIKLPPGEAQTPGTSKTTGAPSDERKDADEAALREITAFLLARTGHDFTHYKRATVLRRIGRRLQVNSLTNLPDYLSFLRTHNGEAGALLQDLLISVTNFFRDPEAFAALQTQIAALFRGKKSGDQVRVWVAGCATGEEAYSVAMLLVEHAATLVAPPSIQVFATDIDEEATRAAREGRFPQAIAADVSPERLRRFFILDQGFYRVRTELRELVLFASHNILRDSPFSNLDLVTCRNLLIYFQPEAQEKVFNLFHFALRPDGVLFLGGSEAADEADGLWTVLDKKQRIYGRRAGSGRRLHLPSLSIPTALRLPETTGLTRPHVQAAPHFSPRPHDRSALNFSELHLRLLEQYSPPSVLITYNFDIVHLSEHAGRFLHFAGGNVSTNLMDAVHPALRLELRAALMRAVQGRQGVDVPALPLEIDGLPRLVDLRVRPLREEERPDSAVDYLMVVFDDRESDQPVDAVQLNTENDAAVRHLEREAGHLKQHLASTIEQYEATTEELKASNEELQAMNEELRSAGEELETSKEELQASNEELITVNQEMKSKVEQLARSNGDLQNLMTATSIATIFLDRELCIQRFTPPAVELFNLIPTDAYRPLSNLRHSLQYDSMIADAQQVIDQLLPVEREVSSEDGRWFLVRVLPYRTIEDRIDGVVFTFVDVTRRHEAEAQVRLSEVRYRSLFNSIDEGFYLAEIIWDETGKAIDIFYLDENPAAIKMIGQEAKGRLLSELGPNYEQHWRDIFGHTAKTGQAQRLEHYAGPNAMWFDFYVFKPEGVQDDTTFSVVFQNITERKRRDANAAFLAEIANDMSRILTVDEIMETVGAKIGAFLKVDSCLFVDVDDARGEVTVFNAWNTSDVPSLHHQTIRLSDFISEEFSRAIRAGDGVIMRNTRTDPRGEGKDYSSVGIGAFITVPFHHNGVWTNYLAVTNAQARDWRDHEIELFRELANRIFPRLERARAEAQLQRAAEFDAFRVRLADALRPLSDPIQIQTAACSLLGEHLQVDRTYYAEINEAEGYARVERDYLRGDVPSLTGSFSLTEFGSSVPFLREGETIVVADTQTSDLIPETDRELMATIKIAAHISAPLVKADVLVGALCVTESTPRLWSETEIELVRETAERIWAAIDRAHAEAAERKAKARYEQLFNSIDEGFYVIELMFDDNEKAIDYRILETNPAYEKQTGLKNVAGKTAREIFPDLEEFWFETYGRVALTGKSIRLEHESKSLNRHFDVFASHVGGAASRKVAIVFQDITTRKRNEEALRESEERQRLAIEAAEMGTWQWDLTTDQVYWNERHFLLFGMTPRPNPIEPAEFFNRVHSDDREAVVAKLQTAIEEKSIFDAEFRAVLDTGETRWMTGYGRVVEEAEDGRATRMSGVMIDINERKEAEKRIHEIEARFRLLVDSVHDYAIITVTPDNLIETWNPGAAKIFGYEETEVLGQPGDMLFIPEDREKGEPQKELETARREGRSADERWHLRQDGSRFYASGVMTALQDDSRQGFVKILRDLTAEKQAEEALQASELRFRTQSDALPQIIWTNEPNGVANHFNKRWFDYSGLSFEASFGLGWQKIVHPTDGNNAMLRWQAALEKGEVFETEYRLRNSDGNYRWHIARNVPLRGDNGQILGWFGTATDIQELKDAEEELSQSRDLLEARVEERTQSLQERTIALQKEIVERQRLEDQTRQLMQRIVQVQEDERRRISRELHDNLGQHAAAILLSLQVLQDADAKRPAGERRQSAAQLARLHQAMNDLMMMTHRLAWELRPAILDNIGLEAALTQYLKEWERPDVAVDFMSRLPESGGLKAEIGLSPDAETALYRVVQECLTNVLRHANASQVSVVLESRADYVTVIVEDNGCGFDVDAISTSKRLGVRGMQERMELVGGTLEVESQPGAGTTIYARVPLDRPKAEIL